MRTYAPSFLTLNFHSDLHTVHCDPVFQSHKPLPPIRNAQPPARANQKEFKTAASFSLDEQFREGAPSHDNVSVTDPASSHPRPMQCYAIVRPIKKLHNATELHRYLYVYVYNTYIYL
jgi:hypothetical protein